MYFSCNRVLRNATRFNSIENEGNKTAGIFVRRGRESIHQNFGPTNTLMWIIIGWPQTLLHVKGRNGN